jgi:hypothetical protein
MVEIVKKIKVRIIGNNNMKEKIERRKIKLEKRRKLGIMMRERVCIGNMGMLEYLGVNIKKEV